MQSTSGTRSQVCWCSCHASSGADQTQEHGLRQQVQRHTMLSVQTQQLSPTISSCLLCLPPVARGIPRRQCARHVTFCLSACAGAGHTRSYPPRKTSLLGPQKLHKAYLDLSHMLLAHCKCGVLAACVLVMLDAGVGAVCRRDHCSG